MGRFEMCASVVPSDRTAVVSGDGNDEAAARKVVNEAWNASSGQFYDAVCDPGVKKRPRIEAKAAYKYKDSNGKVRYSRVRDIARLALQFETVERLLDAIPILHSCFDVVDLENRFASPTMLGWRDVTMLV